jgi:hypothetical protein
VAAGGRRGWRHPAPAGRCAAPPPGGPGPLDLAQVVAAQGEVALPGGALLGDQGGQGVLGLRKPAAEPGGHGQIPVDQGPQRPVGVGQPGQGLPAEGGRALGVAAEAGQARPQRRDRRRGVGDQAGGPADRRLIGLIGNGGQRLLGLGHQRLHRL